MQQKRVKASEQANFQAKKPSSPGNTCASSYTNNSIDVDHLSSIKHLAAPRLEGLQDASDRLPHFGAGCRACSTKSGTSCAHKANTVFGT
jgi:hypothetical protein